MKRRNVRRHATDVARPPRVTEWLLSVVLRGEEGRVILGDLREDYAHEVRARGERAARSWFRREALGLLSSVGWSPYQPAVTQLTRGQQSRGEAMRTSLSVAGLVQDLFYARRAVGRDRALIVLGTVILGIGIAASVSIFSVVRPLLLQSLPFPDAERLVWIANVNDDGGLSGVTSRASNLMDFRRNLDELDGVGGYFAFFRGDPVVLSGDGDPETLVGVPITHDFLDVLGVQPARGVDFGPEVDGLGFGESSEVLISHALWQRRFGGAADVVGSEVVLNGRARQIIGITPASFGFSSIFEPDTNVDVFTPFPVNERTDQWGNTLSLVGRLAGGVTIDSAAAEMESLLASLKEENPQRWGLAARMIGLQETIAKPFRSAYALLMASALVMLLIACVNFSNLLLARAPKRADEMLVRSAHGASAPRLVRQLVVESLMVAVAGAVLGTLLSLVVIRIVAASTALSIPLLGAAQVDVGALVLAVVLGGLVGVAGGLAPALQVAFDAGLTGRGGVSRATTSGLFQRRLREGLVVVQVGLACSLLVLGSLLLGSFQRLLDVNVGFASEGGWVWKVQPPAGEMSFAQLNNWFDEVREMVAAISGIERVGLTDDLPLGDDRAWGLGLPGEERDEPLDGFPHIVSHEYLETMQIAVLEGRSFELQDTQESTPVAILNETAARQLFPEGGALGRQIRFGGGGAEVIGIAEDIRHQRLEREASLQVYLSMKQTQDFYAMDLVVFSELPEAAVARQVGTVLRDLNPNLPITEYRSLESVLRSSVSARRFTLTILATFALTALLLAALGIYGVLSSSVSSQQREIGIRMALGETAVGVLSRVVGRTVLMATAGVALGVIALIPARRVVESLLFEMTASDPRVYAVTTGLLIMVSALAGLGPALRAAKTDSSHVLRS